MGCSSKSAHPVKSCTYIILSIFDLFKNIIIILLIEVKMYPTIKI